MVDVGADDGTVEEFLSPVERQRLIDGYSHHKRRHFYYKKLHQAGRKYQHIAVLLTLALIVFIVVGVFLRVANSNLELKVDDLRREIYKLNDSLESSESRVLEMLNQYSVAQDQYPELTVLSFDELIPLDIDYARSILLRKKTYGNEIEFQLLLENTGTDPVEPALSVEFFNGSGELISSIKLDFKNDDPFPTMLEPGMVRSVSGVLNLPATTTFFKLRAE